MLNAATLLIQERLQKRTADGLLRNMPLQQELADFCSNDYLGFSRSPTLKASVFKAQQSHQEMPLGATGSRLLTGNSVFAESLEDELAADQQVEAALLFNSGYTANLALFSCLPQKGDTIIIDELIHSSVIDGCRLSFAHRVKFKHNDLQSLEEKLKRAKGSCYVAIESVYSMDGDLAPLIEITALCKKYAALLIVDEAHAFGVFGKGLVSGAGLTRDVFAVVITFGKALGAHGAAVLGSHLLRNYLVNFARPFIYSTAMPFLHLLQLQTAFRFLQENAPLQQELQRKILLFQQCMSPGSAKETLQSPIKAIILPGNEKVKRISRELAEEGLAVYPIVSPTVPKGKERLRICLHAFNTDQEIEKLCFTLLKVINTHE
ncbi:aminotransferase class I/II-fold pyridoxal phosphate-dependent enzyme [Pedobacter immunditicola]|uniref:aminotransferase class I/II-fold pyridoxal phosphate-dependent enzyme n=1 Tax=Pedobacter immunditicola TaxID=3133440 RepID=UPI0030AADABD